MSPPSHRAFACALALLAQCPVEAQASNGFEDPALATRVTVLDNGLTVLTLEDHTTPVVSWQVWVKVGAGDEARYTGLAHLFEHMMFRGSKNLPPEAHGRLIGDRGGRINAFTSLDVTVYFADITREHLPLVVELEAERLKYLDISEESLASGRGEEAPSASCHVSTCRWLLSPCSSSSPERRARAPAV